VRWSPSLSDTPRLGVGVAGLGLAGQRDLAAVRAHPGAQLVAVADPHDQLRAALPAGVTGYRDVGELCADPRVAAVWIATPHELHFAHATAAARAGRHIIVEKPLALTLEECDGIAAAAASHRVQLVVGHTESFAPAVRKARELIDSAEFGTVRMITSLSYTDFLYRPRRAAELDTARGGGIVFNQLPHQVDVARFLAGSQVRSVRASLGRWDPQRPTEGSCAAFLDFESGCVASLVYSGYDHLHNRDLVGPGAAGRAGPPRPGEARRRLGQLTVGHGDEAQLRVTQGSELAARLAGHPDPADPPVGLTLVSCEGADLRLAGRSVAVHGSAGYREVGVDPSRGVPGRAEVIDELLDAVAQRRPARHDAAWGRHTLQTCLAILCSARDRREIRLAPPPAA